MSVRKDESPVVALTDRAPLAEETRQADTRNGAMPSVHNGTGATADRPAAGAPESPSGALAPPAAPQAVIVAPAERASEAMPVRAKAMGDVAKSVDLGAVIRLSMAEMRAARAPVPLPVEDAVQRPVGGRPDESAEGSGTVAQATWSGAAPSGPAASSDAMRPSSMPPRQPPAERVKTRSVETIAQPRAGDPLPASPASVPQSRPEPRPEPRDGAAATDAQASASQASASPAVRIVLHYRGDAGEAAARRLADALRSRGLSDFELRRVPVRVSEANIRFFYDENRPVARRVSEVLNAMGERSQVRDFTRYAPLPSPGTVEVWLPG